MRECLRCHKQYEPNSNVQKYCCKKCFNAAANERLGPNRHKDPDYYKNYYASHREERTAYSRAYSASHSAEAVERTRSWRERNRDRYKSYNKTVYEKRRKPNARRNRPRKPEEMWAHRLLDEAKSSSKDRRHSRPTITAEWVLEQYSSQKQRCYWTGMEMFPTDKPHAPRKPSLDRLDATRGYDPDNVVLTTWFANRARGSLTVQEFTSIIDDIRRESNRIDAYRHAESANSAVPRLQ